MIIYEVNLKVNTDIFADYYAWLLEHIRQILEFEGFVGAEIAKIKTDDQSQLRVSYYLSTDKHLQNYLGQHAAKMRAEAVEKFGDKFSATRRIMTVSERIDA